MLVPGAKEGDGKESITDTALKFITKYVQNKYGEEYPLVAWEPVIFDIPFYGTKLHGFLVTAAEFDREHRDHVRTIYKIGNHFYQQNYGSVDINH